MWGELWKSALFEKTLGSAYVRNEKIRQGGHLMACIVEKEGYTTTNQPADDLGKKRSREGTTRDLEPTTVASILLPRTRKELRSSCYFDQGRGGPPSVIGSEAGLDSGNKPDGRSPKITRSGRSERNGALSKF